MRHEESSFVGADGVTIYRQAWRPDGEPAGAVVLVHGVGEHSGVYGNIVRPMVEAGFAVFAHDHRGHGRSGGPRVHVDSWSQYRDDLGANVAIARESTGEVPLTIYGHSMGSIVVLEYLLGGSSDFDSVIISGVATEPIGVAKPYLIALAKALTRIAPRVSADLHISNESLTRDPAVIEAYRNDPLRHGRATVRWGTEMPDAVDRVKAGFTSIDLPALVVHGEADPLNSEQGARHLHEGLPTSEKRLCVYPGVLHEPHADLEHERLAADVVEWLVTRARR